MATIEENAKQLAAECDATHDEFGAGYRKGLEDGYIIGGYACKSNAYLRGRNDALKEMSEVIERKEREVIEKACKRYEYELGQMISLLKFLKGEDGVGLINVDGSLMEFRKALEEI